MLGANLILAALLPLLDGAAVSSAEATAPPEFQRWFEAARQGELEIPADIEREARRYRYVFIAGFYNERMPAYFSQNAQELRERGGSREAIHFLYPSSHQTIEENAKEVRDRFLELAALGPEPLVVIGHSRGACDALYFALENPGFVQDRVRALFLVQGPFGGTDVADYVVGDGPAMDRRIPLRYRALANVLGRAERFRMNLGKHSGLAGLARYASRRFWDGMLAEHPAALPLVGPKTFYITSEASLAQLRLFKRATGWYLQTFAGPNDGVVALEDQSLPGLGTVVAVLEAGHSDLTNRGPATRAPRQFRRALIQAVLMKVGHPDGKPSSTRAESAERQEPIRRATFQAP